MALRGQTVTLLILFIAVLFAYYQKSKNHAMAPRTNVTEPVQGPQLPVVPPPVPSSTFSAIIQETTDAMHHILPSPPIPHLPLKSIPIPTSLTVPHAPSVPKVNILKYLSYIPSPISLIRYLIILQVRLVSFLVLTTVVLLRALFTPILTLLAPVIVLLTAVFHILILIPYRAIVYLGQLLYPIYVFIGTAVILGACVGMVGGAFYATVVMPAVEPGAAKSKRQSLRPKPKPRALEDVPPLSFPEREGLHDVTKWVEESWYVPSIGQVVPSNGRSFIGDIRLGLAL